MIKENKGITLVALVITVIILLILAAITLGVVLGENGLIEKAKTGADSYKIAAEEEGEYLNEIGGLDLASNKAPTTISGKVFGYEVATSGSGTESDPYLITNKEQLYILGGLVNRGISFEGKYFKLCNDIELDASSKWVSIGSDSARFEGILDGNGKTISNLNINTTSTGQGLFGCIGENGTVKKIKLEGSVSAGTDSGCIAAWNFGTISECINNCTFTDKSNGWDQGGICGNNHGTIEKSANFAHVKGYGDAAGISGYNAGIIKECYNVGNIECTNLSVGGIVGSNGTAGNTGRVFNCYNNATITGSRNAGVVAASEYNSGKSYIYNCYTIQNTTIVGQTFGSSTDHKNNYTTNANTKVTELNNGIDEVGATESTVSPWVADDSENPINGGYPILSWQVN